VAGFGEATGRAERKDSERILTAEGYKKVNEKAGMSNWGRFGLLKGGDDEKKDGRDSPSEVGEKLPPGAARSEILLSLGQKLTDVRQPEKSEKSAGLGEVNATRGDKRGRNEEEGLLWKPSLLWDRPRGDAKKPEMAEAERAMPRLAEKKRRGGKRGELKRCADVEIRQPPQISQNP